ncbi:ABC transporter, ATP-binding protein [Bacteriovorax sp. BSW11_IV]|uniref:ABC transporter ATP-binding protein n=1 Tax=Bacteriovorax sp. BSW11_IV TaxID=1353529 RepID=UPI00038A21B8|nr:ABC transporter ATP-binding protein [Bacteriovorax sp. BSW11_IV]EQC48953.1 ABC transporter, ATP-binding protein [Bacteriovorax sp. BSW11_IV]
MSLIQVNGLTKNFANVDVLKGIDLSFEEGEHYVIRGASGSGKSTLLYLLGGLDRPTSGSVEFQGVDLARFDDDKLAKFRNQNVGFVFQFHFLLPNLNCLDNIILPSRIGGRKENKIKENSLKLAEYLGVSHCLSKFPFELSGGEQQRINIIRALSLGPKLLLCDEPTGNLDSENSRKVTALLKALAKEFNSTMIVVTHDDTVASQFHNVLHMKDGLLL